MKTEFAIATLVAVLALVMASWLPTQVNAAGIDVHGGGCIGKCETASCCGVSITLNTDGVGLARNFKCVAFMETAGPTERAWICGELGKKNAVCPEVARFCPVGEKAPKEAERKPVGKKPPKEAKRKPVPTEAEWKQCRRQDTLKACCNQNHLGGQFTAEGPSGLAMCCWDATATTSGSGSTTVLGTLDDDTYQPDTSGRSCSEQMRPRASPGKAR